MSDGRILTLLDGRYYLPGAAWQDADTLFTDCGTNDVAAPRVTVSPLSSTVWFK
jgi:hypothetical protein